MSINLHNLKPSPGSSRKRKRVGRGNASGHGTYSTRGLKGQRSRSGGKSGLKLKGFKQTLLNAPKLRGFKSPYGKPEVVNLKDLELRFKDGEKVNPQTLKEKGIIDKIKPGVKILSKGDLKKKLTIQDCKISKVAQEKIEKAGGKVVKI